MGGSMMAMVVPWAMRWSIARNRTMEGIRMMAPPRPIMPPRKPATRPMMMRISRVVGFMGVWVSVWVCGFVWVCFWVCFWVCGCVCMGLAFWSINAFVVDQDGPGIL